MAGLVDDILETIDDILGIRDELGALKHPIYILTRSWPEKKGKGEPQDVIEQILPSPNLVDLTERKVVKEAGTTGQADIIIKMVSKNKYVESEIDCSVDDDKTEKWYYINGKLFEVVGVTEDYVYFNIMLKKTLKNKVYL
jgi:hypothetical protein